MKYIDISISLSQDLPCWPTDQPPEINQESSLDKGGEANTSRINTNIHTGTHLDAPYHFFENGQKVNEISLDKLMGKCLVLDFSGHQTITTSLLKSKQISSGAKMVLFKTDNSNHWSSKEFNKSFTAVDASAADWIVKKGISLVGIDYLSIEPYNQKGHVTHKTLLRNQVVILEGLNLKDVKEGEYELILLPIKIKDAEGAPARAILKTIN